MWVVQVSGDHISRVSRRQQARGLQGDYITACGPRFEGTDVVSAEPQTGQSARYRSCAAVEVPPPAVDWWVAGLAVRDGGIADDRPYRLPVG